MEHLSALEASLEAVAANCEDVVPPVYASLFEKFPEYEALFALDTDMGVRGHMLNEAVSMAEGLLQNDPIATYFISAMRMDHEGYGVPDDLFESFYRVMSDVFRDIAGEAWSDEMTAAWVAVENAAKATKS